MLPRDRLERIQALAALTGQRQMAADLQWLTLSKNGDRWLGSIERYLALEAMSTGVEPHPFLPGPDPAEVTDGELVVGLLPNGGEARLSLTNFSLHSLVVGTTNSGKSTFAFWLVQQAMELPMKAWIITPFAGEAARHFIDELASGRMLLMDERTLKLNPLQPVKGQTLSQLLGVRADAGRFDHYWRDGTSNLFDKTAASLYARYGTSAQEGPFPSLYDLHREIQRLHFTLKRQAEYAESLDRAVGGLLRHGGEMFDCSRGMDIAQLAGNNIIFNLGSLDTPTRIYVLHCLVDNLVAHRQINPGPHPRLLLLIDEASVYLSIDERRGDLQEPFLYELARRARHHGITLLLCTQTAFDVGAPLMANINNKVVFRVEDGNSKRALAAAMGLDSEQVKALGELPERVGVAKVPSFPAPFILGVPEITVPAVGDPELARVIEDARARGSGLEWQPRIALEDLEHTQQPQPETKEAEDLTKLELDYLEYVATHGPEPGNKVDEHLGLRPSQGSAIRKALEKMGYIRWHRMSVGRGGQIVLGEVMERARALMSRLKVTMAELPGIGGYTHRVAQWAVCKDCEKKFPGCIARVEQAIEDGFVDVSVRMPQELGGKKLAYEIFISGSPAKELKNVLKCLTGTVRYDHLMMVCETKERLTPLKEMLEREVGAELRERISYALLQEFLASAMGMKD